MAKKKIPNHIETLADMVEWVENKKPDMIIIGKNSKLKKMREFDITIPHSIVWGDFRGIPIEYL